MLTQHLTIVKQHRETPFGRSLILIAAIFGCTHFTPKSLPLNRPLLGR